MRGSRVVAARTALRTLAILCSAWGVAATAFAADVTAPAEVAGLTVARSGSNVALSWTPVTTDAAGRPETIGQYRVYRGTSPSFVPDRSGGTNRIGTPSGASFSDPGAFTSGGNFYYLVSAVDAAGNESVTAPSIVVTPPVLTGSWTQTTVELSWSPAQPQAQVVSYKVYWGRAPGNYESVQNVGTAMTASLSGLTTNTFYWCAVRAVDVHGNESAFSNEVAKAVAGRGRVRAHNGDELCWGAAGCPPLPGQVQRADGWQLNVPADFPQNDWTRVTVTYTIDSRLCSVGHQGTADKCGDGNPGGYNPCGDPWDRVADLFLVLDEACLTNGQSCVNENQINLMHAITPFGTDAPPPDGSGAVPPRVLTLDITPFASVLRGHRWIGAEIGHFVQAGWHVTSDFDFSERTDEASPKRPAIGLDPVLWDGGASVTTPKQVTIPANAQQVFGRFFVTGHGGGSACEYVGTEGDSHNGNNGKPCASSAECPGGGSCQTCDEFCHRRHRVQVDGQDAWVFVPWRTDCSPGSITACSGWNACGWPSCTFSRAGWCPGYVACHKNPPCDQDVDLTAWLTPGATHDITWLVDFNAGSWGKTATIYWYDTSGPQCGNGVINAGEVCDGPNLGGQTCQSQGFNAGTLACNGTCTGFNTSNCRNWACGNGWCETGAGENCVNCLADCAGKTNGPASGRYCCGATAGNPNPVPCSDSRCVAGGLHCE